MVMVTATRTATSTALSAATSTVLVAHDAAADADVRQFDDVDSEFFALIYSDPELLRDEFEQLVASAWSGRPPPTAAPGRGSEHPADRPPVVRAFAGGGRPAGPVGGARDGGARTRSPPTITTRSSLRGRWPPREASQRR